jgi:CDP-glucose 4,6-dehydratase
MGARVFGFALPPSTLPNLFDITSLPDRIHSTLGDIRDYSHLKNTVEMSEPDIIFHMAAQPLVGYSYLNPQETYSTNVIGTVNILEAARSIGCVKAIVNVTTDKCYENKEWDWGYRENDSLGGYDPYSSSKACAELVSSAYKQSFFDNSITSLATARAGNVVGGGDWTSGRLIPDILKSFENCKPLIIRNPNSIRPWQHVLEPLYGYLLLAQRLYEDGQSFAESWNFGPRDDDAKPVNWVVQTIADKWGNLGQWQLDTKNNSHESQTLKLDISKAINRLGWVPKWPLTTAITNIVDWHKSYLESEDMFEVCKKQINFYANS